MGDGPNKSCKLTKTTLGPDLSWKGIFRYISAHAQAREFCRIRPAISAGSSIAAQADSGVDFSHGPQGRGINQLWHARFQIERPTLLFRCLQKPHRALRPAFGNAAFQKELKSYKTGKGSIQFPNDAPLPMELIEKIVRFRVKENLNGARTRSTAVAKSRNEKNDQAFIDSVASGLTDDDK